MTAEEYALLLRARLPRGDVWPTADETDGTTGFDLLLAALSQEPARVDADIMLLLEKIIPDNANTDLAAWEEVFGAPDTDLTDAERLARIRAKLRKQQEIDLSTLQAYARKMAGDDAGVVLHNRARYNASVDILCAGDNVGDHSFTWLCELYPNVLAAAPDDFESWTYGAGSGTNAQEASPVTLDTTAALLTPGVYASISLSAPLTGTADGDTVRASVWVYVVPADATDLEQDVLLRFVKRDGTTTTPLTVTCPTGVWCRLEHSDDIGSGSSTPYFRITHTGGGDPRDLRLSWACAGVIDTALEERISAAFPLHTRGEFGIQGEWSTLLAQAPEEAMN